MLDVREAYGGNVKSGFVLEKLYVRLSAGINLVQEKVCGNWVAY